MKGHQWPEEVPFTGGTSVGLNVIIVPAVGWFGFLL